MSRVAARGWGPCLAVRETIPGGGGETADARVEGIGPVFTIFFDPLEGGPETDESDQIRLAGGRMGWWWVEK